MEHGDFARGGDGRRIKHERLVRQFVRPGRHGRRWVLDAVERRRPEVLGQVAVDFQRAQQIDKEPQAGGRQVHAPWNEVEDAWGHVNGGVWKLVRKGPAEDLVLEGGGAEDDVAHGAQLLELPQALARGGDGVVDEKRVVVELDDGHADVDRDVEEADGLPSAQIFIARTRPKPLPRPVRA